jgi:hypothetical protein
MSWSQARDLVTIIEFGFKLHILKGFGKCKEIEGRFGRPKKLAC